MANDARSFSLPSILPHGMGELQQQSPPGPARQQFSFPTRQSSLGATTSYQPLPLSRSSMTESEFEQLPPAVRRKYFSQLERLRYAHHGAPPSPVDTLTPSGHRGPRESLATTLSSRPSSRHHGFLGLAKKAKRQSITQADAQWYLSLPRTVRKKQFSREEQVMLAGTCETVMLDATDEAFYKLGGAQKQRELRDIPDEQSEASTRTDKRVRISDQRPATAGTSQLDEPDETRESSMEDWFRWLEEEEEEEDDEKPVRPDNYHANIVHDGDGAAPRLSNYEPRKPSFHKRPSLEARPSRIDSRIEHAPVRHSSANTPRPRSTSDAARNPTIRLYPKTAALTGDSAAATYYQDPHARLKLRLYLGSPSKFDEAIEYGFPSVETTTGSDIRPQQQQKQPPGDSRRSGANEAQSFLYDDDQVLFDDDDNDSSSSAPDVDGPPTPSDIDAGFRGATSPQQLNSTDSGATPTEKVSYRPKQAEPYAQAFAGGREMTMRMTLTRPELRESDVLDKRDWHDPLALGALPPLTEDRTGALGPFGRADGWGGSHQLPRSQQGSGNSRPTLFMRRVWRKMTPCAKNRSY